MKNILFVIIISLFCFSSCDSFLTVEPRDFLAPDQYYNTEVELQTALTGVYSTFIKSGTYLNNLGRLGLDADEAWNYREVGSVANYLASPNDTEKLLPFWRDFYAGIARANMLLQNVDKSLAIDEHVRNVVKGEALFLRAYFYFMLVSNFGDVPLVLEAIETADLNELRQERTPAEQVYEQIIRDLEEAAELVEDIETIGHGGRANKSAVYGILARVNLYMAGYPLRKPDRYREVIKWTDMIMTNSTHKLNVSYQDIFVNYATDKYDIEESIFELEFMGNGVGLYANLGGFVGVNNGIQNNSNTADGFAHAYLMSTYYAYDVFGTGDLRRDWAIAPFTYNNDGTKNSSYVANRPFQKHIGKFRRISETLTPKHISRTPQNYPIVRFADILLMRAEAENEVNNGPNTTAYECINTVRRRGYGLDYNEEPTVSGVDLSGLDYAGFLEQIQQERTRELAFENMRKADLVRWGILLEKMQSGYYDSLDALDWSARPRLWEYFRNPSERDVLWPIPGSEMDVNPNLTQNPGY